ncbi:hemagglutinin repeat-containing protein [Phascolarctobacterium succinatutens]|uniref:two-partner secretion domain-containing protein n=1 Tax=Phascolarctobacterium succinatutens TaxID=626940 RepID=UPI0025E474BA|nr:hemagglutinin repeat-containing protein [Phascolarctobacterium succinatutens]
MGKFQSRKKKLIAYAIIVSLQMQAVVPCYTAFAAPKASAPVVDIAASNAAGLSHNKAGSFNVGKEGLVFNNNAGKAPVDTALAGKVNVNANLAGNAAKTILQEVTGTGATSLNGFMEIAGSKANLIIANPNGINVNGAGFINVDRAVLTTGRPNINTDGTLNGFTVEKGKINVAGAGIMPVDQYQYQYAPASKLDIYAYAADINAEIWAQDEINVIAGKNQIDANGNPAAPLHSEGSGVNLDIGALGGMYAGKISLVGTNQGLGMKIGGNLAAQKNLSITNNGKIVFEENKRETIEIDGAQADVMTSITSGGDIIIDANNSDIENKAFLSARGKVDVELGGTLDNSGKLIAGEEYEEVEGSGNFKRNSANLSINAAKGLNNTGALDASNNLTIRVNEGATTLGGSINAMSSIDTAAKNIVDVKGSIYTANGSITIAGEKVKYSKENLQAKDEASISIKETDPDKPVEPPKPELPRTPDELINPEIADISGVAGTVKQDKVKDESLGLVADANADGKYKPIIDHAANGADLVQIAEVNANGVSRNLYTDFNIKSSGLILNNATKYVKTELGGYIDRNMFLAGKGARVILNEVTSSKASTLNGYLEVAGNKASVVIANANGISVNGLGFINTDNVIISTGKVTNWADGNMKFSSSKGDMLVNGDGLNGRNPKRLDIVTNNLTVDRSELWGNELHISADGFLENTSKIGGKENVVIHAGTLENTENGYIESGKDMDITVAGRLHQEKSTLKSGADATIAAGSIVNEANSLISAAENMDVKADASMDNNKSTMLAGQTMKVSGMDITNANTALMTGQDLELNGKRTVTNTAANIYFDGNSKITAGSLVNKDMGSIHTGNDSIILADNMLNTRSAMDVQGNLTAEVGILTNEDSSYIGVGKDADIFAGSFTNQSLGSIFVSGNLKERTDKDFVNEDGLIAVGASGEISADNIYNRNNSNYKQGSVISAAGDLTLNAENTLLNRSSDIESEKNITINAGNVENVKDKFVTDWDVTYEYISYKIPHLEGSRYYDAMREFTRTIHTGVIKEETNDANIIASGSITINADNNVTNHYSKIMAGKDLTIDAGNVVENIGYQGTIHHDDLGQDNHYWKYKKHKRWHIGCHWVYGTTVIPYEDHNVYDQKPGADSERLAVLCATGSVKINAAKTVNKTLEADGKQYEDREKTVPTDVEDKLSGNSATENNPLNQDKLLGIESLNVSSKIYKLNNDPSAKYLIETNKKYADYHEFLSSDYLLERVKADPEKVGKRLGDGYFEQKFVIEQIAKLTGRPYLGDYGSDMEQFAALMEAGAVAAEELNLEIGVALTAEQMASLTSDIVWLVEEEVNGQKVLVPEVFLASVRAADLTNDGALIVGGDVAIYSKENIENIGTIKADGTEDLKGENINNLGGRITGESVKLDADKNITNKGGSIRARVDAILKGENVINEANVKESQYKGLNQKTVGNAGSISAGQNLSINAEKDIINKGSVLAADKKLDLNAGQNVDIVTVADEKHVGVVCPVSSAEIHSVENQQSVLTGGNVNINAGSDVNIQCGLIAADKDTAVHAGGNVNINAVKDSYSEETQVGSRGGSNYYHDKVVDEKVKGTNIAGKEDISVSAGSDINVKGSSLTSGEGKASLAAGGNVNITNENEYHEKLHESHEKSSGFLSSKTTDIYDYSNVNGVVSSNVSAGSVDIQSGKDTNVTGSNVAADNDVSVKAGGNLNIESAEEKSESEYIKSVKKSGLLSGGGLGFIIGKEKRKDQYANQNTEQVGSTVGSLKGSVGLEAQKDANIKGSSVIAKENINISGSNVNIENTDSIYNAQEKHEFKRSGISVSIGGQVIDKVNEAVSHVERANQVEDKRLAALHGYKAVESIEKNAGLIKDAVKDPSKGVSINVSIGSTKSKSESSSTTVVANGSNVKAKGNVQITSTEKDINIKGSNVEGKDVTLDAKENINVTASETTNKLEQNSKSSSASVGVGFDIVTGQVSSATISGSKSKGEVDANSTSYNESTVKADKKLDFTSAKDTNIKGGKLSGEKVTGNVGGDLDIESKQDKNSYEEKNSSAGFGIGMPVGDKDSANKIGIFGSAGKSDVDSKYESVTDQSGIYAGTEGFDINVGENTDLKGGIISSEAEKDKNKISTGTLTYEDIQNKADYKAGSIGINVDTSKNAKNKDAGVTPNIGVGAKDNAESVTKATVSEGEIEIRDKGKQKQDLKDLNRDTQNSLNKLGEIFDKTKVEERQELAGLFGEIAYKAVGDLAIKNGWQEGSAEKNALHALVGGIMSELTNSGFLAGASGAMINEMIQDKLSDMFKDNPAMHQWASALIGGVVAQVAADNAQAGAGTASSGTKNNFLTHEQERERRAKLDEIDRRVDLTEEEKAEKKEEVNNYYIELSRAQTEQGKTGEKEGFGYEYGYDPELGGSLNVLPDDINAQNGLQQYVSFMKMGESIDSSDWKKYELRTYTFGKSVGIKKIFDITGAIGIAKDQMGNVYKVYALSGSKSVSLDKLNVGDIMKSLSYFDASISSQVASGTYENAEDLRKVYTKLNVSFSVTKYGVNVGISRDDSSNTGSYGINNTYTGGSLGVIKLEFVGNVNEGL